MLNLIRNAILCTLPMISGTALADWWRPNGPLEWQWELDHVLSLSSLTDLGTGKAAANGARPPATNPVVYDIDGFDNPAAIVAGLHGMLANNLPVKVVCYISVGTAESWRTDYFRFPATALGRKDGGWAGERYVDITNPTVVGIMKARIAMCARKKFDAIETDNDETYTDNTGFKLTKAIEETYETTLANYAHRLNLAVVIKNPDDTGDSYAADMRPVVDAALTEQCNEYDTCGALSGYTTVFDAEYSLSMSAFCPKDRARKGWNGVKFTEDLNGPRTPCN
jgi:hypothetical protein